MEPLRGESVYLRLLETTDIEAVLSIENNQDFWGISGTQKAFSRAIIKEYLANAQASIKDVGQLRLAVCLKKSNLLIGLIDLFNYDDFHKRAGVGIVIERPEYRRKGYSSQALKLLSQFARDALGLKQLYANILIENEASIALFERCGFEKIGIKKKWRRVGDDFKDELLYQHIV